jgi:hypothetical protein
MEITQKKIQVHNFTLMLHYNLKSMKKLFIIRLPALVSKTCKITRILNAWFHTMWNRNIKSVMESLETQSHLKTAFSVLTLIVTAMVSISNVSLGLMFHWSIHQDRPVITNANAVFQLGCLHLQRLANQTYDLIMKSLFLLTVELFVRYSPNNWILLVSYNYF